MDWVQLQKHLPVHSFCVEIPRAQHLSYLGFSVAASGYQVSRAATLWLELPHWQMAQAGLEVALTQAP